MSRNHQDNPAQQIDDMFRLLGQVVEDVAAGANLFLGPFVDIECQVTQGRSSQRRTREDSVPDTHIDILTDDDEIHVVADLSGVSQDNIDIRCDGQTLLIHTRDRTGQYSDGVRLPVRVDPESASASYNNGILEVTLTEFEPDDTSIDVE